jgi:TAT-translocated FGD2 family F420-dependent dehydrogenase
MTRHDTHHATRQAGSSERSQAVIGLALLQELVPITQLVELGVQAEQAGFAAVWADDHFEPWQDNQGHASLAWLTLAALGQRTKRLLLGTGVTCPSLRYRPQLVAQAFASLGLLYPGRVFLGVGAGEAVNEVPGGGGWGDYAERAARLEEAVTLIRRLWTGDWVSHQGRYYPVERARLYDVPRPPVPPVPIYVAASGPRSLALAGKIGDGLVAFTGQPELRQAFEQGARAAGKHPAAMPVLAAHVVVVGDRREAERWAPLMRFAPKGSSYLDDPDPRSIQRRAEQDVPLEQAYRTWVISDDPQVHLQALQRLIAGGVTHIFVQSPQADQAKVIRFYGEQVLPRLAPAPLSGSRR